MKKEYYWILMEKVGEEGDLSVSRLVPRGTDGCYSISHETMKKGITFSGNMEMLNNL